MARRKDDPREQAAKGYPRRRKKQTDAEIAAAVASAEQPVAAKDDPFALPAFFSIAPKHWAAAIKMWAELSDVLRASGRRRPGYRGALARYCALFQKYVEALDQLRRDLPKGGVSVKVTKGDGNTVYRTHPSVDFMSKVGVELRLLEHEFGFTPRSDSDLIRVESFNAGQGRLPLGGQAPGQSAPADDAGGESPDPADLMSATDSVPPGTHIQ
jgi:P27 family predicted phage terminase small subunit